MTPRPMEGSEGTSLWVWLDDVRQPPAGWTWACSPEALTWTRRRPRAAGVRRGKRVRRSRPGTGCRDRSQVVLGADPSRRQYGKTRCAPNPAQEPDVRPVEHPVSFYRGAEKPVHARLSAAQGGFLRRQCGLALHPSTATTPLRTSIATITRSPSSATYWSSVFSPEKAAVPMITRAAPASRSCSASRGDRMPPAACTCTGRPPPAAVTTRRMTSGRTLPLRAALRSTRWRSRAPAATTRSTRPSGSASRCVTRSNAPLSSRTASSPRMSIAGMTCSPPLLLRCVSTVT